MQLSTYDCEEQEFLEEHALVYSTTADKGYSRIKEGNNFIYINTLGKPITSERSLNRISKLGIPPIWDEVWICAKSNGHLQATGIDQKGRKQYRYHKTWKKIRSEKKFNNLYYFGKNLDHLRHRLKLDLRRKHLDKKKVTALALSIMEITLLRVGNTCYEKEYGSYGLSTLNNKHIRFKDGSLFFKFKGKKGVQQRVQLKGTRLINLLKKVKELPGQKVFQYYDEEKELQTLDSYDINEYLREAMKADFTCKDFRTWSACIVAIENMVEHLSSTSSLPTKTELKTQLPSILDKVAKRLGNTRTVCKNHYIHPELIKSFESGKLTSLLNLTHSTKMESKSIEKTFLKFLKLEIHKFESSKIA